MEKEFFIKKPDNTTVTFYDTYLNINRHGFNAYKGKNAVGDLKIKYEDISGVRLFPAKLLTKGYLQILTKSGRQIHGGIYDEKSIMFTKNDSDIILSIKNKIEEIIFG